MASEAPAPVDASVQPASQPGASSAAAPESAPKPPVKRSWRRKYRKMRIKFDDTMHTSNTLIRDEYRAVAVARRLQEQNDQILELLLDMNETARLPSNLRYDLRDLSGPASTLPTVEGGQDPEVLQQKLQELRNDMTNGTITPEEYAQLSDQLNGPQTIITNRTLSGLEAKVPYSTHVPEPAPEGLILGENAPGYMSPTHEEEYLLATDIAIEAPTYDPNAHDGRPLRISSTRAVPSDKELTIQNPDSVYNWLRKHQPQVFLQDRDPAHPENASEKSSARPANGPGRAKRPSAVSNTPGPKGDPEDEDGGLGPDSGTTGGKGRKGKGEDDGAYRPKGGSSRGSKRKREDGDPVAKGSRKKNRPSAGTAS